MSRDDKINKVCSDKKDSQEILKNIKIIDMSSEGKGIGKFDNITIFIDDAVFGDIVNVRVIKKKKNYYLGVRDSFVMESPYRVKNNLEDKGNSCLTKINTKKKSTNGYEKLTYDIQLELKEKQVRDKLERIGGFDKNIVKPIIPMENPYNYRNKAVLHFKEVNKKVRLGFFEENSNKIIDYKNNLLQDQIVTIIGNAVIDAIEKNRLNLIDKKTKELFLKEMMIRFSKSTGDVMIVFTLLLDHNNKMSDVDEKYKYVKIISESINEAINKYSIEEDENFSLESLCLKKVLIKKDKKENYINAKGKIKERRRVQQKKSQNLDKGKVVYETFAGKRTIKDRVNDLVFEIGAESFYQVNPKQMIVLYDKAMEYAGLEGSKNKNILDLYCGIGTIGLYGVKNNGSKVLGVEIVADAVKNANRNAVINQIIDARFLEGKAEEVLSEKNEKYKQILEDMNIEKFDVAFLDPPRAGCEKNLIETISNMDISKVVYISCDPGTLARDLKIFKEKGYEIKEVTPVDMFPHTSHVECVVLMSRV